MGWEKRTVHRKKHTKDRTNKELDKKQEKTEKAFLRAAALEVKIVGRFDAGFCRRRGDGLLLRGLCAFSKRRGSNWEDRVKKSKLYFTERQMKGYAQSRKTKGITKGKNYYAGVIVFLPFYKRQQKK